jgi:opacity protein-like surface antigen
LRRILCSTNPIENTIGAIRRTTRIVKRWRGGDVKLLRVREGGGMIVNRAGFLRRCSTGTGASSAIIAALLTAACAIPVFAESRPEGWNFEVTPYLFAAGLDGSGALRGVTADIDMSFSDIWDRLDQGFMALADVRKGRWMVGFDGIYIKLSDEAARSWNGPPGNTNTATLNVGVSEYVYQLLAGYRVHEQRVAFDVLGGVRYTRLDLSADLAITTGAPLLPDGSRSAARREDWSDVVAGARVTIPIAERWSAVGYLDYGLAGDADETYQAYAGMNWSFARNFAAKLGYRYLYQDYNRDDFRWDASTEGVFLGLGIGF